MLFGGMAGELEIRRRNGGTRIRGSFPYKVLAVLSDGGRRGGRPKKERFKPGAFQYSVELPEQEIHLLVGHEFGKPLASKLSGSLSLRDTPDALLFEATLSENVLETSHGRDAMAMLSAGLIGGLSPGFRLPPARTVANAESIEDENPAEGNAIIRTVNEAILYELSLVTRPAYPETTVEARNWDVMEQPVQLTAKNSRYRWRL